MWRPFENQDLPLEILQLEPMASGNQSLRLSAQVTWQAFAAYAPAIAALLGGSIVERADSPAERVWTAEIEGERFWISFDDFGLGVSLGPQDTAAAALIPHIREQLLRMRGWREIR